LKKTKAGLATSNH